MDLNKKISPRELALNILNKSTKNDSYINVLLRNEYKKIESNSAKNVITELVYGVYRNKIAIDAIISKNSNRKLSKIYPELLNILRLGAYEMFFMDTPKFAVLNTYVDITKKIGRKKQAGFINAIFRKTTLNSFENWLKILKEAKQLNNFEFLCLRYSLNEVDGQKILLSLGNDLNSFENFLKKINQKPKIDLAIFQNLITRDVLNEDIHGKLTKLSSSGLEIDSLENIKNLTINDKFQIQDEGSQIISEVFTKLAIENKLKDSFEENWLDMCAGVGGKSRLIYSIFSMQKDLKVNFDALEINSKKVLTAKSLSKDFKINFMNADGTKYNQKRYNQIFIDAPCTGVGALRRHLDAKSKQKSTELPILNNLQINLVKNGFSILEENGYLAYSTCSPILEETLGIVNIFKKKYKLIDLKKYKDLFNLPDNAYIDTINGSVIQLWTHKHDVDSMFFALFKKEKV